MAGVTINRLLYQQEAHLLEDPLFILKITRKPLLGWYVRLNAMIAYLLVSSDHILVSLDSGDLHIKMLLSAFEFAANSSSVCDSKNLGICTDKAVCLSQGEVHHIAN
jgi:hypothetical protein